MKNLLSYTDEQLLLLIEANDEAAFTVLFKRYRSRLFYYLLKHTKSEEIAEEIVTDIFVKLWEGRELAGSIREVSAFFHKVGYFKAMDFLRTTARSKRLQQIYIDRVGEAGQALPDDLLISEENRRLLLEAINQLTPRRKLVYRLSREEGLSHEEIARILNLSKSTVNNTIVAASESISGYLKKYAVGKAALSVLLTMMLQ